MKIEFSLPIKPFSINSAYYKTRAIKTKEAKVWEQGVFRAMKQKGVQEALAKLREAFDPKKHSYHVSLCFYFPEDVFWTKDGTMSSRTFDLSNIEKMLIDLIWLPKYHDSPLSSFTKNLDADDKYISKLISEKKAGDTHCVNVSIELKELAYQPKPIQAP